MFACGIVAQAPMESSTDSETNETTNFQDLLMAGIVPQLPIQRIYLRHPNGPIPGFIVTIVTSGMKLSIVIQADRLLVAAGLTAMQQLRIISRSFRDNA